MTKTFYTKSLSLNEIPEIADFFESKTQKGVFTAKGEDMPTFDVENIIEVLDTLKNRNYSFSFTFEDTPKAVLYNLIIGVDSLGQKSTPIVLKYTSAEESYEGWAENGFDFRYFTGTLAQHRYTDFFESGLFSKNDCPEHLPNGDPSPCYESDISNGSVGTGSGGGASSGGGTGGGTSGGCTYSSYFHACGGSNQYTTHGSQGCGGDGGGSYWVLDVSCPNGNDGANQLKTIGKGDCEDCESGPSGGVAANTVTKKAFLIEYNITATQLDPCSSQILSQLKNLRQNDMAMIISRFGTPNTVYDWEIKTTNPLINPNNDAETDWKRDSNDQAIEYDYLTNIKPNYVNQATQIAIARTILHEMLHAYLISLVDDALITGSSEVTNFPILWNALVNKTYNNNPNRLHHEEISRKFITPLQDALKEWDGAKESNRYYEDLAWGALEGTSTFNLLYPNSSTSRNRILNTNRAEDTNSAQGGVTPKSNPCN